MIFGNNIEAMASEKSGWAIIDQSADGSVIYMGKPASDSVGFSDQAWLIKKITTETKDDGSQIIKTQYAEPKYKSAWNDRKDLEYLPKLKDEYLETPYTFTIMYRDIEAGTEDYHYEEKTLYRKNESDTLRDCLNYPINGATRIDNGYDMGDYILHDYAIDDRWGLVEFYKALPILHKNIPTYKQQMRLFTTDDIAPDGTDLNEGVDWSYYLQYETDANMSWFDWLHSDYVDNSDFLVESVGFDSSNFSINGKVKSTGWGFYMREYYPIVSSWMEGDWEVEFN